MDFFLTVGGELQIFLKITTSHKSYSVPINDNIINKWELT